MSGFLRVARLLGALHLAVHGAEAIARFGGLAVATADSTRERTLEDAWSRELDVQSARASPIQRVVSLLEKMKAQLETEASTESDMYDKMVCWCETNMKEKENALSDAGLKSSELQSEIEERAARVGGLAQEIANLKEQIRADQAALKTATAIREKEAAAFTEEENAMLQAITNLKNAIDVLSRHHGGNSSSLVQLDSPVLASVKAVLRDVSLKYELMLAADRGVRNGGRDSARPAAALLAVSVGSEGLGVALRGALGDGSFVGALRGASVLPLALAERALAQAAGEANAGEPIGTSGTFVQVAGAQAKVAGSKQPYFASYSSRSGKILGILKQMEDEFEANLSQEQRDELKAREAHNELEATKKAQIEASEAKLDGLEGDHAENQKALSDAKEGFELTRGQRAADVEFLSSLKLQCQGLDKQWEERFATRSEELKAVTEALTILKKDDARELTAKTVTLLQEASISLSDEAAAKLRVRAAAVLRRVAAAGPAAGAAAALRTDDLLAAWQGRRGPLPAVGAAGGPRAQLATLAVSVELDSFAEVKKVMDKLVADLKDQQAMEVQSKDHCEKEFRENEKASIGKTEEKTDLETELESLAAKVTTLEGDIASAKAEIAETELEVKKASEAREKENAAFQSVVADQRATQAILKKALARLGAFYKKSTPANAVFVQRGGGRQVQTPPEKFNDYKKNSGATPVMGFLEQIIEDSKALEGEAVAAEQSAQATYESFVKSSNKVVAGLSETLAAKSKLVAVARLESGQAREDHENVVGDLEDLAKFKGDLHLQCDFLLKNFDIRQRARLEEIEAIQHAKGILSGSAL
eukprot:CAMPEP_0117561182 /NCGR_PEP_ID=MMETSP0784-20121206/54271_1 /TAXON_ID=39447 /ORGANISM="" /LENGTH=820 /DNA_ID=CAMNT_0005358637 /DNA_START=77 /DNA_END=2539 /DNA_ORIENTATION=+